MPKRSYYHQDFWEPSKRMPTYFRPVTPVETFSASGNLRGTGEGNRRYMHQQMRRMRRRSDANRRRYSRAQPERAVRSVATTVKCKDKDKEGANEYAHHESATRIAKPIGLKELNDMLAPQWTEKVYHVAHTKKTYTANTELVLEFCLMDKNFVLDRLRKVVEVSPFQALMLNAARVGNAALPAVPAGSIVSPGTVFPSSAAQYLVKFEGGKYTYTFMNTCSNTIHFEFRQYKLAPESLKVGAKLSTKSPLKCFQTDQANTWETGDLPFAMSGDGSTYQPDNTARLANWTITNAAELAAAEASPDANLASHGLVCSANIPAFKRPNRSSPLLHGLYNQIAVLKIKLKPGDTFVYDIRINPFTTSGVQGQNLPTDYLVQYYSRILQVYARSEFNVDNLAGGNMATGPGQFAIVSSHTLNWRAVPQFKSNNVIEQAITTATLGPFADITNANATCMEMQEPDPEAYNTVG